MEGGSFPQTDPERLQWEIYAFNVEYVFLL